jgi:uncharacterized phage-associated protein
MSMYVRFDSQKAIQAIGAILRNHPQAWASKLRILKLLYIAARESIHDIGHPLIGSRVVALEHGPVHSRVLDLINGADVDGPTFSAHFCLRGYLVQMTDDPGVGNLSVYEVEKLQEVCNRYATVNDWELAQDITHGFDEWKKHYRTGVATIIPLEDIIDAVGRGPDKAAILDDLRNEINADMAFEAQSMTTEAAV